MGYQAERDQFIARMTQEGMPLWAAERLLREATGINRRAELACSSEAADRDRVPCPRVKGEKIAASAKLATATKAFEQYPCLCDMYEGKHQDITRITLQDWRAEERIRKVLTKINDTILMSGAPIDVKDPALWAFQTEGDPRGYTLRVIPPSYAERNRGRDRHNRDSIGVPCRPSGIRW